MSGAALASHSSSTGSRLPMLLMLKVASLSGMGSERMLEGAEDSVLRTAALAAGGAEPAEGQRVCRAARLALGLEHDHFIDRPVREAVGGRVPGADRHRLLDGGVNAAD